MPKQPPGDIDHTVTTDHWIRKPAESPAPQDDPLPNSSTPLAEFWGAGDRFEAAIARVMYSLSSGTIEDAKEGSNLLRQGLQEFPNDTRLQCWLGFGLKRQRRMVEAIPYLEQAWRAWSNRPHVSDLSEEEIISLHVELAETYRLKGEGSSREALEVIESLMRIAPDYVRGHTLAAELYLAQGRMDAAVRAMRRGLELNPATSALWLQLGKHQLVSEQSAAEAIASLRRALELDPLLSEAEHLLRQAEELVSQKTQSH
jgi:tetratricopeptide (TPR) repeat protein